MQAGAGAPGEGGVQVELSVQDRVRPPVQAGAPGEGGVQVQGVQDRQRPPVQAGVQAKLCIQSDINCKNIPQHTCIILRSYDLVLHVL